MQKSEDKIKELNQAVCNLTVQRESDQKLIRELKEEKERLLNHKKKLEGDIRKEKDKKNNANELLTKEKQKLRMIFQIVNGEKDD